MIGPCDAAHIRGNRPNRLRRTEAAASARTVPAVRIPYDFPSPLRTERLVLRVMTTDDADDVYVYSSREDVSRYLMNEPRTREEVEEKVAEFAGAITLAGDGDYWQPAVVLASNPGRVMGHVYFTIKSVANSTAEIGFAMHPKFSGQGYMTEASIAVLDIAFGALGLHRVMAELDPRNAPSVALCKRLGMREEAHFVEDLWFKGEWGDTGIYAILDREWAARPR
jgi:RimJ/RimL family protein N-acetyltransferase